MSTDGIDQLKLENQTSKQKNPHLVTQMQPDSFSKQTCRSRS